MDTWFLIPTIWGLLIGGSVCLGIKISVDIYFDKFRKPSQREIQMDKKTEQMKFDTAKLMGISKEKAELMTVDAVIERDNI